MADVPVNWCPALGTVLANEEVKDGRYVETGDPVERRLMRQWMLKITEYAERLLDDLEGLDWPESVKEMQRNWIGKSRGADVVFAIAGSDRDFTVFTTRPDTLFGATYCVFSPEHPLVAEFTTDEQRPAVDAYIRQAAQKSDLDRTDLAKSKTGVFTGAYAVNPVNDEKIPIWVADYVLMGYGTGAIMAVPGHDERDHEFARAFDLPIIEVVSGSDKPIEEAAFTDNQDGVMVNSTGPDGLSLDGLKVPDAIARIIAWLEERGLGTGRIQYRLRDWLFSRQRYWGEPFPIVHTDDGEVVALDESWLPVGLPAIDEYRPTEDGRPPLARAGEEWLRVELPDGRWATRETNTMPQWAGSCWYYLRFLDPHNESEPWSKELENYWMPIDLYVGGVEHAVLHLLYARFWHKVLYDCGWVSTKEPFQKLFNQGMILAYSFRDSNGKYYLPSEVDEREDGTAVLKTTGETLESQIEKMSKSKLNVVNPDDVISEYGADSMRLYELFMGPLEVQKPWQMKGVEGVYRFLQRTWRLVVDEKSRRTQLATQRRAIELRARARTDAAQDHQKDRERHRDDADEHRDRADDDLRQRGDHHRDPAPGDRHDLPAPALAVRAASLGRAVAPPGRDGSDRELDLADLRPGALHRRHHHRRHPDQRQEARRAAGIQGHRPERTRTPRARFAERAQAHGWQTAEEGHRGAGAVGEYRRLTRV